MAKYAKMNRSRDGNLRMTVHPEPQRMSPNDMAVFLAVHQVARAGDLTVENCVERFPDRRAVMVALRDTIYKYGMERPHYMPGSEEDAILRLEQHILELFAA